jgi:hypothetical protein
VDETTTEYKVVWFPPDAPVRERTYTTEAAARSFIRGGERNGHAVKDWNPILLLRTVTVAEREIPQAPESAVSEHAENTKTEQEQHQ